MEEKFIVRFIVFSDGERYPILLNSNGQPHWYPTLYITTHVRNASKSPNTMAAVLAAIRVLLSWSALHKHDLGYRFLHRKFLNEQELESLRHHIQAKANDICQLKQGKGGNVRRIEDARGILGRTENRITASTQYIRMSYIADYLEWLAIRVLERNGQVDTSTADQIQRMVKGLRKRRPQRAMRSLESARKGLTEEQQKVLLDIIQPGSQRNPFTQELQTRNQLIICLLYHLGLRAGELLSLRVSDFDFQNNTVLVARRHDNPSDPRTYQPVVKTIDRRMPLSDSLVKAVSGYIMGERRRFPASKRHDYLFVVQQRGPFSGKPISLKGLDKLFREIKSVAPALFSSLTPHVLRHTANDKFSVVMDKRGVAPAEEEKMRSYLMGWKEGSGTSSTYIRRHIENKAREAALLLQD